MMNNMRTDAVLQPDQVSAINRNLVGYSNKINDPRIAKGLEKVNRSGVKFMFVVALVAVLGFTVAGALEVGDFKLPFAFYMGLGFGVLLMVISLFSTMKAKNDKGWDAVVVDKVIQEVTYAERRNGNYQTRYYVICLLGNGQKKKLPVTEEMYHYYQVGDRVRHHAGTAEHILEKFDKSGDTINFCIVCSSKNAMGDDICHRCKAPLLK